jgi:hypothetical protein
MRRDSNEVDNGLNETCHDVMANIFFCLSVTCVSEIDVSTNIEFWTIEWLEMVDFVDENATPLQRIE